MKKHWILYVFFCLVAWAQAGNRADINADQVVNSTDMTVLANLMTGNLDIAGYDLANVVVVAPQGGDFTDPAAAANWVATQSPSASNRFLIWVAPGDYSSGGTVYLPSYTTLKGAGWNSVLNRPSVVAVSCSDETEVVIADLRIISRCGASLSTCSMVLLRNLMIDASYNSSSFDSRPISAIDSSDVIVEDCVLNSNGGASSTSAAYLVFNSNSTIQLRGCTGSVSHARTNTRAIALYMFDPGDAVNPEFRVENCRLTAAAATAGYAYYLRKDTPAVGWTRLFNCILLGTNNTTTQLVRWNCCDPDGVAIP
jgi:hypothetical protein